MSDHQAEQSRFAVALAARRFAPRNEFGNHPMGPLPNRRYASSDSHGVGLVPSPTPREVVEIGRRPGPLWPAGPQNLDEGITAALRRALTPPSVPSADAIAEPLALVGYAHVEAKAPKAENVASNFDVSLTPPAEAPPREPASNGFGNIGLTPSQRDWLDLITKELATAGY